MIREIQDQLVSGQTKYFGCFVVKIHEGDPTGRSHPDNRRHQAWITESNPDGEDFNHVVATPTTIQAKTLREFCWDVAVWLCDHRPIQQSVDYVIEKNGELYDRLS